MRRILTTAATVAVALATLVAPASADEAGTQAVACEPNTKVKIHVQKRDHFIDALGGFFDCDMPNTVGYTIQVQMKQLIGWKNKVPREGSWPRNQYTVTTFSCSGQGTRTYRAQMIGLRGGGDTWVRNSGEIKVSC